MPSVDVTVSSVISQSIRCRQVESLFDVPPQEKQTLRWVGDVPLSAQPWHVGLIVGPSGSGKSIVAKALFPDAQPPAPTWTARSVIDDFPPEASLVDISAICQAVGFNTIPAWLRPHAVLSNGEQFRVLLARLLLADRPLVVLDEFTSVVDRQVAKIASHAVQKYIRKRGTQFVAVSCHSDIIDWLNPDWILEPATMTFAWRALQRRPPLEVTIQRVDYAAWRLFAPYHYMSAALNKAAQCFCLFLDEQPVAFAALLHRPLQRNPRASVKSLRTIRAELTPIWGVSRVVTLPDYQGLGLAFVLMDYLGSLLKALDVRLHTYPAHPALIRSFDRWPNWRLELRPGLRPVNSGINKREGIMGTIPKGGFGGRPNAVFSYVGPTHEDSAFARRFLDIPSLLHA